MSVNFENTQLPQNTQQERDEISLKNVTIASKEDSLLEYEQPKKKRSIFIKTKYQTKKQHFTFFLAEFLGTSIFMFIGCATCIVGKQGEQQDTENIAIVFGLAYMISVMLFSHISRGFYNPIFTIAAVIVKQLSLMETISYFLGQFTGAFFGFFLIYLIAPNHQLMAMNIGVCSPYIEEHLHVYQGFICEFLISLIMTAFACVVWEQYQNWQDSLSLVFGLSYVAVTMSAISYTGAHMNPFRSLAPAAINRDWNDHWVYWLAPISASIISSLTYRIFFTYDEKAEVQSIK